MESASASGRFFLRVCGMPYLEAREKIVDDGEQQVAAAAGCGFECGGGGGRVLAVTSDNGPSYATAVVVLVRAESGPRHFARATENG